MNNPRTEDLPQITADVPKKGDVFSCDVCGMEIRVTKDCQCENMDEGPHFTCCGKELSRTT